MKLRQPLSVALGTAELDRALEFEIARMTEDAAIAAARFRGQGNEEAADRAAVIAMRSDLKRLPADGGIVIGEGEHGQVDMLYVGERLGQKRGAQRVDIAVAPVEGTTLCAKNLPSSMSCVAIAPEGGLMAVPDVYMNKIAIGPGYPAGLVDLDRTPAENLAALAAAKGVKIADLTVAILDRPRHTRLIAAVNAAGADVKLLSDGDVAAILDTTRPDKTGVDAYLGIGRAPQAVLAAAALSALGGQMQARFVLDGPHHAAALVRAGITDFRQKYAIGDFVRGDVLFAATGITDGALLPGVRFSASEIRTETLVTRSSTRLRRVIQSSHGVDEAATA